MKRHGCSPERKNGVSPWRCASVVNYGFELSLNSATMSRAAFLASSPRDTSNEIAPTRACPPPPYRSQIFARLTTGWRGAHGFDPTDTFTRKLLLLRPTLYTDSGCR